MPSPKKSKPTPVKAEKEGIQNIPGESIDRVTPPEIIMQQEQRERLHIIDEDIELNMNLYEKEKKKIKEKVRKLEKSRQEMKSEHEQKLYELQRQKAEVQEVRKTLTSFTIEVFSTDQRPSLCTET